MARAFDHATERKNGVLTLTVSGVATVETARTVHEVFRGLARKRVRRVELNAHELTHADLTFLQLVLALRSDLVGRDIDMVLQTGDGCLQALMRASGFTWGLTHAEKES